MHARFAGSARLDERRRRRLASEADDGPGRPTRKESGKTLRLDVGEPGVSSVYAVPLERLVASAVWKHVLFAIGFVLAGSGLLAAARDLDFVSEKLGPGVVALLEADRLPLFRLVCGAGLLMASQTAFLIWWIRSRSQRDFDGHYRVWPGVAVLTATIAACQFVDLHLAWNATLGWLLPPDLERLRVVGWLVPAGLMVAWLFGPLCREMQDCRASWGCLVGSMSFYLVSSLAATGAISDPLAGLTGVTSWQLACIAHALLMLGISLHARHVIYHTADPSLKRKIERPIRAPFWSRLFQKRAATATAPETTETGKKPKSKRKPPTRTKTSAKVRIDEPQVLKGPAGPTSDEDWSSSAPPAESMEEEQAEPNSARWGRARATDKVVETSSDDEDWDTQAAPRRNDLQTPPSRQSAEVIDTDGDTDGDNDEGPGEGGKKLSKKERRRLAREQRRG